MRDALDRIINSQKNLVLTAGLVGNAVASLAGAWFGFEVNPTEGLLAIVNGVVGVCWGAQFILDLRWGSASDGTGRFDE